MGKALCIIPARGGSKRIPRKNIRPFLGKPIIAYSIEVALQSGLFKEVMVSTDDEEIAQIAREYGASVPFMRSAKNADDFATTADVINEVLESYSRKGIEFEDACCIYATAPLIRESDLKAGYDQLTSKGRSTVFPVSPFQFPIWRSLKIDNEGTAKMIWPENATKRSQDLMETYHDAGQWYWLSVEQLRANKTLHSDNTGAIVLSPQHVQDIDHEDDWELAEMKFRIIRKTEGESI